jgi:outer membrane protein assembly factor BamB
VLAACVLGPVVLIAGALGAVKLFDIDGEAPGPAFPTYPVDDVLQGRLAWTAPGGSTTGRLGWLAGTTLVYADLDTGRITGLDTRDGSERWSYRLPAPVREDPGVNRICSATRRVLQGTVAISFQRDLPGRRVIDCSGLVLLDLRTGRPRWETVRPNRVAPDLAFAGGRLVIADYSVSAYDLTRSTPRWTHSFESGDGCQVVSVAGSARVVAVAAECGAVRQHEAWTLDPATGTRKTRTKVGSRPTRATSSQAQAQVVSAEPVVIAYAPVDEEQTSSTQILSTLTDDHLWVRSSVELPPRARYQDGSPSVLITGHRMVVATDDGRLVCYDLRTGRPSWVRADLAPDGHAEEVSSGRAFLAGTDGKIVYGVVADLSGRTGVFGADLGTSMVTMLSPALTTPFKRITPPVMFLSGNALYGVNAGEQFGAAFAIR